jgi:putative membrane protein
MHMRLDIAGFAGPQNDNDKRSDQLLPVGDLETGRFLIWEVLPAVDLYALPTVPLPARARWLHPIALRSFGAGLTNDVFVSRWGLLTRELQLVPYARLQSVRVVQGPIQRLLRLATVYADTAGGRSASARDRDVNDAWRLAEQLTIRARYARGPAAPPASSPTPTFRAPVSSGVPSPAPSAISVSPSPSAFSPASPTSSPASPTSPAAVSSPPAHSSPAHSSPAHSSPASPASPSSPAEAEDAFWRRPSAP